MKQHWRKQFFFITALMFASTWNQHDIFALDSDHGEVCKQGEHLVDHLELGFPLEVTGGLSGGYFYASNPAPDGSESEFLLSNLLLEISSGDLESPVEFVIALGQTSTPSILDMPENSNTLSIEYASLAFTPLPGVSVETGLLGPNSGYEATYTYGNRNILLGAVASQQPYNAYGAKVGYEKEGLYLWGGYYRERLDDEEYGADEEAWEIGVCAMLFETDFSLYHYHIGGFRQLTGASIERTFGNIDVGLDMDYWRWLGDMNGLYGDDTAVGGALYVTPTFDAFSLPVRLEYIRQGESRIYVESVAAENIYTATVTPTYHFADNTFVRVEAAYTVADQAFGDAEIDPDDDRISLAMEIGFLF